MTPRLSRCWKQLKVNRMLEDLDVAYKGIKVIDEDALLNALRVNGMLGRFDLRQDNRFDDSPWADQSAKSFWKT